MNLDRVARNLEKKYNALLEDTSSRIHHYTYLDDEPEALIKEREAIAKELEQDAPLLDHLADHHVVPILEWKLEVGLETKIKVGSLFTNCGKDYENLTIEEEEYFRLMKKRHEAIGWNPKEHKTKF